MLKGKNKRQPLRARGWVEALVRYIFKKNKGFEIVKIKAFITGLAMVFLIPGCQPGEKTMPQELIGIWMTSAPKYKECFLELSQEMIVFGSGHYFEHMDINYFVSVEKIQKKTHILYTIHYENIEGQKSKLPVYYVPLRGGSIRFKNQKKIEWRKINKEEMLEYFSLSP